MSSVEWNGAFVRADSGAATRTPQPATPHAEPEDARSAPSAGLQSPLYKNSAPRDRMVAKG